MSRDQFQFRIQFFHVGHNAIFEVWVGHWESNRLVRETLHKTIGWDVEDRAPAEYIWKLLDANVHLERTYSDYVNRDQEWSDAKEYYPAQELKPLKELHYPRDWQSQWTGAGGILYGGRMIARLDDPIWLAMSDFGFPFKPFSFDTGMFTSIVSRREANDLGIEIDRPIDLPPVKPFKKIAL